MKMVEQILLEEGPTRSSRLLDELVREGGLTPVAARKRVSRSQAPISRFPIQLLPKRESFLYHEKDRNTHRFWTHLVRDLHESGSVYGIALNGLIARGGTVRTESFNVISGAPAAQKGQLPSALVLQRLEKAGLVVRVEITGLGECVSLDNRAFGLQDFSAVRARAHAEAVLLDALREWVRKLGLASYNAIAIRSETGAPRFTTFFWDLVGPSYLLPLAFRAQGKTKPGFLVADVFCDVVLDSPHIRYFLRKCTLLSAMKRIVPFMPILLADEFTTEALRAGRQAGLIMATPRNLFGGAVATALESLLSTLKHAAAVAVSDPDRIGKLLNNLSAIEGAAGNLRGALFEMIVGYLVREVEGTSIDIGEIVRHPQTGKLAEIDVRRIKERQECWVYECRGRQPNARITLTEVRRWLEKVDLIAEVHRQESRFQNCAFGFELWTTGGFEPDALDLLQREKKQRRRIILSWRDGEAVRDYAKRAHRKSILGTLNEHYFRHPLALPSPSHNLPGTGKDSSQKLRKRSGGNA